MRRGPPSSSRALTCRVLRATTEQCLICHGSGKLADIKAVHAK